MCSSVQLAADGVSESRSDESHVFAENPTTTTSTFTSITALASSSTASLCTTAAAATPTAASTASTATATASSATSLFPTLLARAPPTRLLLIGWDGLHYIGLSGGVRHAVCAMGIGAAASRHHSHVAAYLGQRSGAPATSLDTHGVLAVALAVSC